MGKRVEVKTEMKPEELHERYRKAKDPVERTHWHILWQVKEGKSPQEVAELLGYTAGWVRSMIRRWHAAGEAGITDHRRTLPGAKPLLTAEQQSELAEALLQPPLDGGLWSGPKVAAWMQMKLGREIDPRRGWDYLQRLGYSTRVPRPQHAKADEETQRAFKKLPEEVETIRQAYPQASVELWSTDEHRIGLKPILRRVWARKAHGLRNELTGSEHVSQNDLLEGKEFPNSQQGDHHDKYRRFLSAYPDLCRICSLSTSLVRGSRAATHIPQEARRAHQTL